MYCIKKRIFVAPNRDPYPHIQILQMITKIHGFPVETKFLDIMSGTDSKGIVGHHGIYVRAIIVVTN